MRVLLSPRIHADPGSLAWSLARALAGPDDEPTAVHDLNERAFRRPMTLAEIHMVRAALLGRDPDRLGGADEHPPAVVGYICAGRASTPSRSERVIAVADHVNLTWRSPLTGPNDERLGPRFPVVAGVYAPEVVVSLARSAASEAVGVGVVAGVRDDGRLSPFESEMVRTRGYGVVSSDLVPVALLAAHLGIRLAATVVIAGSE